MRMLVPAIAVLVIVAGAVAAAWSLYYQTSDFFCLWNGARALTTGMDPYDEVVWRAATGGLYPDPRGGLISSSCAGRFAYPLWTAVALAPFGVLPLEVAASLWASLAIGATLAGTWLAVRAAAVPTHLVPLLLVLVAFSQPFWLLLVSGQISGVMLALAGAVAWATIRGRDGVAGAALAGIALKPQVGALFVPLMLVRALATSRRRFVLSSLGVGALLFSISVAVAPRWPVEWADEVLIQRTRVITLLPTAWGLAADLTGAPMLGLVLVALMALAVWAIARSDAFRGLPFVGIALSLSLFAAPHLWSYDFLVLVVPWAVTLGLVGRAAGVARVLLLSGVVACASLLPWALYAVAFTRGGETLSAVIPAATALLLAAAVASTRDASVAPS